MAAENAKKQKTDAGFEYRCNFAGFGRCGCGREIGQYGILVGRVTVCYACAVEAMKRK
jgi:hypothetical protein